MSLLREATGKSRVTEGDQGGGNTPKGQERQLRITILVINSMGPTISAEDISIIPYTPNKWSFANASGKKQFSGDSVTTYFNTAVIYEHQSSNHRRIIRWCYEEFINYSLNR